MSAENETKELISEMVLGIISVDGMLSQSEIRGVRRIMPEYSDVINMNFFEKFSNGFSGIPSFFDCARKLKPTLSDEEKDRLYRMFKSIAEVDGLAEAEERMLKELTRIWNLKDAEEE